MTAVYTPHHGAYLAHRITLERPGAEPVAAGPAPGKRRGRSRKADSEPSLFDPPGQGPGANAAETAGG